MHILDCIVCVFCICVCVLCGYNCVWEGVVMHGVCICVWWMVYIQYVLYIVCDVNVYACVVCMYLLCMHMCCVYSFYVLYLKTCVMYTHVWYV